MPLDALHIKFIASELQTALAGGRIDKITAPSFGAVRFAIYASGKTHGLFISINPDNAHLRLTSGERQEAASVPVFVAHLKKHLIGAIIGDIYCLDNERIVFIELSGKSDLGQTKNYKLVAELMGKHSNIMLLDDDDKIKESFKHIPLDLSSKRQILPGIKYTTAPPQIGKINPFDSAALNTLLKEQTSNNLNLAKVLSSNVFGLAPATIREIAFEVTSNSNKKLQTVLDEFSNKTNFEPCFTNSDFYFKPYLHLELDKSAFTATSSLLEAVDSFYGTKSEKAKFDLAARRLNQIVATSLSRAQKRLGVLLERQQEAQNADEAKMLGELLIANLYRVGKNDTSIQVDNYYVDPPCSVTINLSAEMSPQKQAENYFKKYRKAKKTLEMLVPQLEQTEGEIEYLESVVASIERAETVDDLDGILEELFAGGYGNSATKQATKKKDKQKPKSDRELLVASAKRTEFLGYTILTGRNNLQNDALVKSSATSDVWLHPKEFRGSHTVIVNPKKTLPPDNVLVHAATICAKNSKAKFSDSIPVDYTFIKFVSKPKGATAGKVIYTNQKTIWVKPD